jgi:tripartite-type tricarboxylate transporter receptor subunit TctC
VALVPYVLVTGPNQPDKTLKDLFDHARAKPGTIDYGSLGIGSGPHVVMEMMNNMAGTKMNHVPYKASPVADIMADQIPMTFDPATTAVPLIKTGKVKALAVTSKTRNPQLPDVPAVTELLPGFDGDGWQGLYVPTGTPRAAVVRYQKEVAKILQRQDIRDRLLGLGLQPVGSTPEEFAVVSKAEVEKWGKIAKANNIRAD